MIVNIFKIAIYHHSKKNFLKAKEIYETLLKTNPFGMKMLHYISKNKLEIGKKFSKV
jgi:hypothetical protein